MRSSGRTSVFMLESPSFGFAAILLVGMVIAASVSEVRAEDQSPVSRRTVTKRPWSLDPVKDSTPPQVKDITWPATSIDPFILAPMEAHGMAPSPRADKLTLIRRVTFDLTGLPPTPDEIDAYLADSDPNAYAKVVDRLLASPRYGEHWGRHWLDVVRYADTAGDTADYPLPEAWRYRNYVIDSMNADMPYDQFVREQIAGDILAKQGSPNRYAEQTVATGFLALSRRFGFDSENYQHLTIQDTIDTLGQSVLGLTMGCARCHDHKFDPLSMRDYYGLYGIFESTRYAFPGSEQKGKYRSMVPMVPCGESQVKWREMQSQFASFGMTPVAVLRSLDDLDGDFEMQHIAAGGSKGVPVPPWFYEGKVSITQAGQSPFKHLHPFGIVGASVVSGVESHAIRQTFHPAYTRGIVHVNLEFRAASDHPGSQRRHRFVVGAHGGKPVVEVFISGQDLTFEGGSGPSVIRLPKPGDWNCLQLALDLSSRTFSGSIGVPGNISVIDSRPFANDAGDRIDSVALDSRGDGDVPLPGLDVDNIGVQDAPMDPVATSAARPLAQERTLAALKAELEGLAGMDGDLEAQTNGTPPAANWHPGLNSGVRISAASQSPFANIYPAGTLGIRLPATAGGGYNGFGNRLPTKWDVNRAANLNVSFDFRCGVADSPSPGTWRFQIGHSYTSPAVEMAFNSHEFFRRSGDAREIVTRLQPGEWYQVRLSLDLKSKTYTGSVATRATSSGFSGTIASGWDGAIDYLFIDSGGHVAGAKSELDTDNFMVTGDPLPALEAPEVKYAGDPRPSRIVRISELRASIGKITAEVAGLRQSLESQLASGPVPIAYGVSEGTPHHARLQERGEPDKPGAEIPRGFISVLGNAELPASMTGSGRLELAEWLTRPDNPLTARVMVNRIWQYHFGRGLVSTSNDFGNRSEPPLNPDLLDHLASRLMKNGWSVKDMHRLILLSATWRQSAVDDPSATERTSRYGAFPRRRLSAEELRDAVLSVSGALDLQPGREHPFPPSPGWGFTQHAPFAAVYDHDKRSVYLMVQRNKRHPFLALFDGADPNSSTPERRVTTVPTQALYFLNDPFVHAKSIRLAERLQASSPDEGRQIEFATRLALGRLPDDAERAEAVGFLSAYRAELAAAGSANPGTEALAAYARTLFGSNEFLHCD